MKTIFALIFFVLHTGMVFCQVDSEVYAKVIDQYVLKLRQPSIDYSSSTTLTVREIPVYMKTNGLEDFAWFKQKCKRLEKQTFINFIEKNPSTLNKDMFDIPGFNVVILKNDMIPSRAELIEKYPDWIFSILAFSNIGFNEDKSQALVYYSFDSGSMAAGGIYLLYEKKRRKWKQKGFMPSWAS